MDYTSPDGASGPEDVKQTADSSTADPGVNPPASDAARQDDNGSDSSTDQGVKTELKTIEDIVADSVKAAEQAAMAQAVSEEAPASEKKAEDGDTPDTAPEEPESAEDQVTDEEKSADKIWHEHPASKAVMAERKKARQERDEARESEAKALEQVKTFEALAKEQENLQHFLKHHKVPQEDFLRAMQLVALVNTNPVAAYEAVVSLANQLGAHTGSTLPPELQQKVQQGFLTPEDAAQIARAQGQVNMSQAQIQRLEAERREADNASKQQQYQRIWEHWTSQRVRTDPDLGKKIDPLVDRLTVILQRDGPPKSDKEAWDRLDRAYADVNSYLSGLVPKRAPVAPSPRSEGLASAKPKLPPVQTAEDAAAAAVSQFMSGQ
jgi:hypothetical protein